jgi:hypothetical protein
MHLEFDRKFVVLVVLIIVIIIAAIVIFRMKYCTQEDRDANRNKFLLGTAVVIAIAIGVYLLTAYACEPRDGAHVVEAGVGAEYGIRESIRERWDRAKAVRQAESEAKKAGGSPDEVRQAGREAKSKANEVKRAKQDAAFKAGEAAKQKLGLK